MRSLFRDYFSSTPIPDHVKLELVKIFNSFTHPTLGDPIIFMMLVMIVMFDNVKNISDQCWTLLARWIKRMVGEYEDSVKTILQLQGRCLDILPVMTSLQAQLL